MRLSMGGKRAKRQRSPWWILVSVLFGIIGGVIAFLVIRHDERKKAYACLFIGAGITVSPLVVPYPMLVFFLVIAIVSGIAYGVTRAPTMHKKTDHNYAQQEESSNGGARGGSGNSEQNPRNDGNRYSHNSRSSSHREEHFGANERRERRANDIADHYATLGLSRGASEREIKERFRELAKRHHPDRDGGDASEFMRINRAYNVLSDPESRRRYDAALG